MDERICPACSGQRVTEKVEHSVETDSQGNQKPVQRHVTTQCGLCGGAGVVTG